MHEVYILYDFLQQTQDTHRTCKTHTHTQISNIDPQEYVPSIDLSMNDELYTFFMILQNCGMISQNYSHVAEQD